MAAISLSLSSLNPLFPNVTPSPIRWQAYISLLILILSSRRILDTVTV